MWVVLICHFVGVKACRWFTQSVGDQFSVMLNEFFGVDVFEITPQGGTGSKTLMELSHQAADRGHTAIFVEKCRHLLRNSGTLKQRSRG